MIRSRYRNTVRNCHSYPGDHNVVAANLKQVRYKKIKSAWKRLKWNLSTLANNEEIKKKYVNEVENAVNTGDNMLRNEHWNHIKNKHRYRKEEISTETKGYRGNEQTDG